MVATKNLLTRCLTAACFASAAISVVHADPHVVGSSTDYAGRGTIKIKTPPNVASGDVLLLFLNRSDGPLPIEIGGEWKTAAICLKQHNEWEQCITAEDCEEMDRHKNGDVYCKRYEQKLHGVTHNRLDGEDLGTAVFFKTATEDDMEGGRNEKFEWDLDGKKPAWAILTAVRGADTSSPIRDWAGLTCDSEKQSRFPSVYAQSGDLLVLHQGFDDPTNPDRFGAPSDTAMVAWTTGEDETAFLFEKLMDADGSTDEFVTTRGGGPICKDVQISMSVAAALPPPTDAPSASPSSAPSDSPSVASSSSPSTASSSSPSTAPPSPSTAPPSQPSLRSSGQARHRSSVPDNGDNTPDVVINAEEDIFAAASSSSVRPGSTPALASAILACVVGAFLCI